MTARFVISNLSNFKYVPRLEILVTIIVLQTLLPNVFIKKMEVQKCSMGRDKFGYRILSFPTRGFDFPDLTIKSLIR